MEKIPVDKHGWIEYDDQVFVLKPDPDGVGAAWQADGCCCRQCDIDGMVVAKFKTTSKWFNPTWWYKKTCWGAHYPNAVYFDTTNMKIPVEGAHRYFSLDGTLTMKDMDVIGARIDAYADTKARPAEKILKAILHEVNRKTGMHLRFMFNDTDYGQHWFEAYIPVRDEKDNAYVITWMNCD